MSEPGFDARLGELIASSPHGLVSAGQRDELATRHVPEARALARWLGQPAGPWMDLGTGGGLPGLVLASERPEAEWVLVDARRKKAREAERFAEALGVRCRVVAGRAEELAWQPEWRGAFGGVVARAVAPLGVLIELARGFLVPEGRLVAVKGRHAWEEVEAASTALERLGTRMGRVESLGAGEAVVVEVHAVGAPPEGVPRRAGVPERRPWSGGRRGR